MSKSSLAKIGQENDRTQVPIDGRVGSLELSDTYGNITVDGSLTDWTKIYRLDTPANGTAQIGYELYGKYNANNYLFAIKSTQAIGTSTTIWLNTDRDQATGYQIFGFAGGAEYNINFAADGKAYLYSGADGQNYVAPLDYKIAANGLTAEIAVPTSLLGKIAPTGIDVLADVNNQVFLPGDYMSDRLSISSTELPTRTNFSKRIAIVYSETSANNFFDKKAYNQLFAVAQSQAIAAGIPFDLITENELKDLSKLVNYDVLVFPSFTNVNQSDLRAIESSLTQAVTKYGIGIITSSDFMTNDETGNGLAGDPYRRMKKLLGIQRTAGGGVLKAVVNAKDVNNNILTPGYTTGEQLINYDLGTAFAAYNPIDSTGTILAEQTVNGATYNAIVATKTGGQNVHFANQSIFADSNIVAQAIDSIIYKDQTRVTLDLTRNTSLFLSRNDVDLSRFSTEAPIVESKLADVLTTWKNKYGFVGTHFINIGNDPANGESTDWSVMKPIYQRWLALGNEIGTHSHTHPEFPSNLTTAQAEFEFNQSKNLISQQLGIKVSGAATPGNPDSLALDQQIDNYFQYYTGVGTAYNSAFGFLDPTSKAVYFAPNISFDYNAIGFLKLTNAQTETLWNKEYNQLRSHTHKPIVEFAWHDYGATGTDPAYNPAIYDNFIARAAADDTEFVTFDDAQNRLRTFQKSAVTIDQIGDVITSQVTPDNSTTGVGKFSLDIQSTKQIKNVDNYYAFDKDSVFLPKIGGNFTINLGTAADNITHIVALAQRAELLSVTGDGQNLDYTFNGEGKISIDLNLPTGKGITTTGADSYTLIDNRLEMTFNQSATHTATVVVGNAPNNYRLFGSAASNIIQGYAGDDILVAGSQNYLVIGGAGNDTITGGSGKDLLVGVDPTSTNAGKGEIDTLIHSGQGDRFILGDVDRVYYDDGNSNNSGVDDYANLVGFSAADGDVIQLKGNAADYFLGSSPNDLVGGTAIYNNLFGQPELIGIVQNVAELSLTGSSFNYV